MARQWNQTALHVLDFRKTASLGRSAWIGLALAVAVTVLIGLPVLLILLKAISHSQSTMGTGLFERSTWQAAKNSLQLGLLVAVMSVALGVPLAFVAEYTPVGRIPFFDVLSLIPMLTPPYISSIGWILFMEPGGGYIQRLLPFASAVQPVFFSLAGLVFIMGLHLFPVVYFGARQAMRRISSSLNEAARVNGLRAGRRWISLWIPMWTPTLLATGVLVFVKSIGEFGSPLVFGSLLNYPVLTTQVYQNLSSWPINFTTASQLASLLLVMSFLAWIFQDQYQRRHTYAYVSGRSRSARAAAHPVVSIVGGVYAGFLFLFAIGIPYFSVSVTSFLRVEGNGLSWSNFTLQHYGRALQAGSDGFHALLTSFTLALVSATAAVLIAVLMVLLIRFRVSVYSAYTEFLILLPNTIPDVLLAVGLILFWNSPWLGNTLYNTPGMLIVAFVILFLPYAFTYIKQALFSLAPSIWEAAVIHRLSRWTLGSKILLPLLLPSMLAGWMMVFAISFRDLVMPMLLSPPGLETVSTYVYGQFDQGDLSTGMAMALLTALVTVMTLVLAQWLARRSLGRHGVKNNPLI